MTDFDRTIVTKIQDHLNIVRIGSPIDNIEALRVTTEVLTKAREWQAGEEALRFIFKEVRLFLFAYSA